MEIAYSIHNLRSAAEVTCLERALIAFRTCDAKDLAHNTHETDFSQMTMAQRLDYINREWTIDELREIKPWALHNATVLAVFDLCAASPGSWITFKEACLQANMINSQGRGQMQALSKKARRLMHKQSWPVAANATPPGIKGLAYCMPREVAERWLLVRSEP